MSIIRTTNLVAVLLGWLVNLPAFAADRDPAVQAHRDAEFSGHRVQVKPLYLPRIRILTNYRRGGGPYHSRVNRKVVALCSALLIVLQMVIVPVVSAISGTAEHKCCGHGGAVHVWQADDDCGDASQSQHCPGSKQNHSRHTGRCGCVHTGPQTQAVASSLAIFTPIAQSETLASEPKGPAFSAPVLELLRPPD